MSRGRLVREGARGVGGGTTGRLSLRMYLRVGVGGTTIGEFVLSVQGLQLMVVAQEKEGG